MKFAAFAVVPLFLLSACTPSSAPPGPSTQSARPAPSATPAAPAAPATPATSAATHDSHAPATIGSEQIPSQRHETDAPLRKGMAEIRTAVDALGRYERGDMNAAQAIQSATAIQDQVAYLVANCKLEPKADAALHGIIAKLGTGALALKADPANLAAIAPMRDGLADYRRTFDDPAFKTSAE